MDFALSAAEQGVEQLSRRILDDLVTEPSLRELEAIGSWSHRRAWEALAAAGLLGVAIPEAYGGSGAGLLALCLLLREIGRATLPSPALCTLVSALVVERYGNPAQKADWLPRIASGRGLLSAALPLHGTGWLPRPGLRARNENGAYRLNGVCRLVSGLPDAQRVLAPAEDDDGRLIVLLVDARAAGISLVRSIASDGEPLHDMIFSDARVDPSELLGLADEGRVIAEQLYRWATLGVCALSLGVAEKALSMTARYASERHQFGRPIGSFQAVSQRAADAYIEVAAMRVSLWQASYRLGANLSCDRELAIAKLCAADGAHRVVTAAQHIHAGVGFDRDYPLHRYFLWAKRLELTLGGANAQLARIGALLAADTKIPARLRAAE